MAGVIETGMIFLGKSVMLKGITETTTSIYNILQSSMISSHPDVQTTFDNLDLNARLEVIQSIVSNIHSEKIPIKIALKNLHNILKVTKVEIDTLQIQMKEHEEKYFSSWRNPEYLPLLDNLEKHSFLIDKRLEMLLDVVKINNSFTVINEKNEDLNKN